MTAKTKPLNEIPINSLLSGHQKRIGPAVLRFAALLLLAPAGLAQPLPAAPGASNAHPHEVLLLDSMGRLVIIPTNQVRNPTLLPPPSARALERQIPTPAKGASTPPEIQQRNEVSRRGHEEAELFPSGQPPMMPYLASQDEFGNTAAQEGALLPALPPEPQIQGAKYWLSDLGLRYSLQQTTTCVGMTDVMQGNSSLAFYTFDLHAKWAVFNSPAGGTAGWISTHIEAKTGLGSAGNTQDAGLNLGSLTDPTGIWSKVNGLRVPELAWQQSLLNGELVLVAGMVDQGNYFDGNAYANSGRGQFINSALIDTMVVPLTDYNFGLNVQWQPTDHWYGMIGYSVGNGHAGYPPWTGFSWNNWSLISEIGYIHPDFLGLGPGIYRIQPFIGQAGGASPQTGLGFNLQQQLGKHSPFGWFGRFGTGGREHLHHGEALINVGSQIGTGFVIHSPLDHLGLIPSLPELRNDLLGVGFVWSHLNESAQPIYHPNEYVLETFYTVQLTPLMRLQPDLQVVWNPAYNPDPGPALVAQLQFILSW